MDRFFTKSTIFIVPYNLCLRVYFVKIGPNFVGSPSFHIKIYERILPIFWSSNVKLQNRYCQLTQNMTSDWSLTYMIMFLHMLFCIKIFPSFLMAKVDLKRNENQQHLILYCSNLSVEASFLCKRSSVSLNAPLDWLSFSANRSLSCLSLLFSSSIATMDGFPLPVNWKDLM